MLRRSSPQRQESADIDLRDSHRLFRCGCCQVVVVVCSQCDRGHRYCSKACASAGRAAGQRASGRCYQQSAIGRRNNANRQRRYRQRQRQSVVVAAAATETVTQHSSATAACTGVSAAHDQPTASATAPAARVSLATRRCVFCGRPCSHLRHDFLQPWRFQHHHGPPRGRRRP